MLYAANARLLLLGTYTYPSVYLSKQTTTAAVEMCRDAHMSLRFESAERRLIAAGST